MFTFTLGIFGHCEKILFTTFAYNFIQFQSKLCVCWWFY